jgi:hypothetical protein
MTEVYMKELEALVHNRQRPGNIEPSEHSLMTGIKHRKLFSVL